MRVFISFIFVLTVFAATRAEAQEPELRVDACPEQQGSESARTTRAADDYDRGLVMYDEGDYRGAVEAFVDSYCNKPHPAALYNIAQSHERLLDFARSVQYFERYISSAAATAPNVKKASLRAEVLRNLPAQLRVATVPPGAAITIRDSSGVRAR